MSIFKKDIFDIGELKPVVKKQDSFFVRQSGRKTEVVNSNGEVMRPASWRGIPENEPFVFTPSLTR